MSDSGFEPMARTISLTVHGEAAPQGSKTRTKFAMREDNPKTKPWREMVTQVAGQAMHGQGWGPLEGPIWMRIVINYARPASHYGTGRNARLLKPNAPTYKTSKPDADKLARAICDALTGVCFRDDAAVVNLTIQKRYSDRGSFAYIEIQGL